MARQLDELQGAYDSAKIELSRGRHMKDELETARQERDEFAQQIQLMSRNPFINKAAEEAKDKLAMRRLVETEREQATQIAYLQDVLKRKADALDRAQSELARKKQQHLELKGMNDTLSRELVQEQRTAALLSSRMDNFGSDLGAEVAELDQALELVRRQREHPSRVDDGDDLDGTGGGNAVLAALTEVPRLRKENDYLKLKLAEKQRALDRERETLEIAHRVKEQHASTLERARAKAEKTKKKLLERSRGLEDELRSKKSEALKLENEVRRLRKHIDTIIARGGGGGADALSATPPLDEYGDDDDDEYIDVAKAAAQDAAIVAAGGHGSGLTDSEGGSDTVAMYAPPRGLGLAANENMVEVFVIGAQVRLQSCSLSLSLSLSPVAFTHTSTHFCIPPSLHYLRRPGRVFMAAPQRVLLRHAGLLRLLDAGHTNANWRHTAIQPHVPVQGWCF